MATTLRAGSAMGFAHAQATPEYARAGSNIRPLDQNALGDWINLLARISHDLRTPLNAVIGFSDAMQNELFGPLGHSRYQEYARHIRTSGDLLLKAAEDTLAMTSLLAAPKSARMDDIQLGDAIRTAAADLTEQASDRGVTILIETDDATKVRGDVRILPRALQQLLVAALARSVDGSSITVTTKAVHHHIVLAINVTPIGDDQPIRSLSASPLQSGRAADCGMGREELSLWLARMLLDQQDCALRTRLGPDSLSIEVEFEQAMQADFFAIGS